MRRLLVAHLLRTITWPHWAEHRLRTSLTVIGISLGVATVVGMANVSASVLASFRHMVRTVAGTSDLEITSPAGDVDENLIESAAEVPGVKTAAGLIESFVSLPDYEDESLCLLGLDFLGSPIWKDQVPADGVVIPDKTDFIVDPDSVVLAEGFMARARLSLGGPLRVLTPGGIRTLRVRGVLKEAPIATLFDGMVAIMDLPAAQWLLGREGRVDRVAVVVAQGSSTATVRGRLAAALGPRVEVAAAEARGRQAERLLFSLRGMLLTTSSLAVIVAMFIVYQTVAVSVRQRRRQFALLNTIGVRRRSLTALCLVETIVLAMLGVILGIVLGELLSAAASGVVGDAASQIWVRLTVAHRARSLTGLVVAIFVGIVTALVAAAVAIRATFRSPTVEALRPANVELEPVRGMGWLLLVGLLLPASVWLLALAPQDLGFAPLMTLLIATHTIVYVGVMLLAPLTVLLLAAAMRHFVRRSRSIPFRLAADNLPRGPWRTGSTVAMIVAVLAMAVNVAGVIRSFEDAVLGWVEQHFDADLFVGGGHQFRLLAGAPMSEDVGRQIITTPGVAAIEPFRVTRIRLDDRPVFLEAISLTERLSHGGLPMVEGDFEDAAPRLRAGRGILLSDNLAVRLGLHAGDTLEVPTPGGSRSFRIEGTFVDYLGSLDLGAVAIARAQLERIWDDRQANLFRVWVEPGASAAAVRRQIIGRLGGGGYYVVTTGEFLDSVRGVLGRFFLATWALQLVAALVGVFGVVNAQLAAVLDRKGEISMMRTIGVPARAIVRAVILECGAIGALGGLGGALLGTMLAAQFVDVGLRLTTGWRMPFEPPLGPIATSALIAMFVSALAGYLPARATARLSVRQQSLD